MPTDMTTANTIAQQIGNRAFRMIGAKNLVGSDDALTFKVGSGARSPEGAVTHIRVTLDRTSDLYKFEALYCRGTAEPKTRVEAEGVYADMLHEMIEGSTGFYTSL